VFLVKALAIGMAVAILLAAGVAVAAVGGAFEDDNPAATRSGRLKVDRFDGRRAFAELRRQVELGPRPAGSKRLRRLAVRLRDELPRGRFEPVPGHPGLRNIVGRLPGTAPAVVVGAHYDTKRLPGFVGANDGAGGTAAVMELARVLRRTTRPEGAPELRFVLFDGEEATDDDRDFRATGLRGSSAYARAHASELRAVVLLDFIADKRLRIPREAGSDRELWSRLRAAARRVGAGSTFPAGTQGQVIDDHTPFAEAGVPAIDLIDFDFPCWHQACDDMSAVSAASLDRSGETVLELLRTWR
jgi:glutaminyl-peptide cyclotransferase